jgi:hypothetical protein
MNNDVRVIIGVPSWCEAPGITAHARRIDDALDAAGFGSGAVIVNADNRSPDNTAGLFMATPTRHRKVTLPTARGKETTRLRYSILRYARARTCSSPWMRT